MKTTELKIKQIDDFTAVFIQQTDGCEWQVFNKHKKVATGFGKNSKYALDSARRRVKTEKNKANKNNESV